MKQVLILLFAFNLAYSQIPNNDFENWTWTGSYYDPNGWFTFNQITTGPGIYTTERGTPGYSGSWYLSLETKTFIPSGYLNGKAISGTPLQNGKIKGYPINYKPAALKGFWKYSNPSASPGKATVWLTRWNNVLLKRDTVCYHETIISGTVSAWTSFLLDLSSDYKIVENPDSFVISFYSSGSNIGSYLHIDDISFEGIILNLENYQSEFINYTCFPNPVQNRLNLKFMAADLPKSLTIIDVNGRSIEIDYFEEINVSFLSSGLYTLHATVNGQPFIHRFLKE